jgi:hypothetical protein
MLMTMSSRLLFFVQGAAAKSLGHGVRLWGAVWFLQWDETSRLLLLSLAGFCIQQRRSRWHVLVSLCHFDMIWTRHSAHGDSVLHHRASVPRANIPLMSTGAENIAAGLFYHPLVRDVTSSALKLLSSAKVSAVHFLNDNASANLKALAYAVPEIIRSAPNVLVSCGECCHHSLDIVKTLTLRPFMVDMPKVNLLYYTILYYTILYYTAATELMPIFVDAD